MVETAGPSLTRPDLFAVCPSVRSSVPPSVKLFVLILNPQASGTNSLANSPELSELKHGSDNSLVDQENLTQPTIFNSVYSPLIRSEAKAISRSVTATFYFQLPSVTSFTSSRPRQTKNERDKRLKDDTVEPPVATTPPQRPVLQNTRKITIPIFGTSCKRLPLVSDRDHF